MTVYLPPFCRAAIGAVDGDFRDVAVNADLLAFIGLSKAVIAARLLISTKRYSLLLLLVSNPALC